MTGRTERIAGRLPARRAGPLLVAALLSLFGVLAPAGAPTAAAAAGSLTLSTASTYTLDPKAEVVHVVVEVHARNDKPDLVSGGVRTRYFYDGFRIGVQPEARSFRATSSGRSVTVSPTAGTNFTTL